MKTPVERVTSASNPTLAKIRKLAGDGAAVRREGRVWLEGDHLCAAAAGQRWPVPVAVVTDSAWARPERQSLAAWATRVIVVPDRLFGGLSTLGSPADLGFVADLPQPPPADSSWSSLVLDRVQDAGNAGSMLRSAAALGVRQVLATAGTVSLWSTKVLRAGMGAHFGLRLIEGLEPAALLGLGLRLVVADVHATIELPAAPLPEAACWVFGNEGQGVDKQLLAASALRVRIPQPGGEESLNVAAAAAICLYEQHCRRNGAAARPGVSAPP